MTERAFLEYEGYTQPNGTVRVFCRTNDDNDDGLPDGFTQVWTLDFNNVESFHKVCRKSRVGISGIQVTVRLDGEELK